MQLQTEKVPCNSCGTISYRSISSETYRLHDAEVSLGIVRCSACQQVYTNPRLTLDSTLQVYQHDTEHTISRNYCWSGDHTSVRFAPLIRRLQEYAPVGKLLDVGCGSGDFLRVCEGTSRWETTGVEPILNAAQDARQTSKAMIHTCVLEEAPLDSHAFDIISLLGVLEHLHEPSQTLATVRTLLKPGGLLAIYVPNFNYLRFKDLGPFCWFRSQRWSDLHPQEHQFHFTPKTIQAFLQNNGFDILRTDVGQPFAIGSPIKRYLKQVVHVGVQSLWKLSNIHLGGLEVIARVSEHPACESHSSRVA